MIVSKFSRSSLLGSNIRRMVAEAGGPEDSREVNRLVKFPRVDSPDTSIRIEGNKVVVDKILAVIEGFIGEKANQTTEHVEVAPEKHRVLIGRGGETRRALESEFHVSVEIPRIGQQGPTSSSIKVTGQATDIARAKDRILAMVKDEDNETVNVPRRLHNAISGNGQIFRRLRNDHKVTVDHAGHQPPTKTVPGPSSKNAAALPLITDNTDDEEPQWHLVDEEPQTQEEGDIPWILKGTPENISKARTALAAAIDEAQQRQSSTAIGYLILPDPRSHRFIIGPKGSQINSIRRETGCQIDVPNSQTKGDPITIRGKRDGVQRAHDIILDLVDNARSRA